VDVYVLPIGPQATLTRYGYLLPIGPLVTRTDYGAGDDGSRPGYILPIGPVEVDDGV